MKKVYNVFLVCIYICAIFNTTLTTANAGWLKDRLKDVKKIVKQVPKIGNPIQAQIDIIRGKKKPDQAIKDFITGQGKAVAKITNSTRNLTNAVDHKFEDVATKIGGDFGRVVYQIGTGGNRLQREFLYSNGNAAGAILQGQDPLLIFTTPLAAAIRDARNKHIGSSKPVPDDLKKLFAPVIPAHILNRARYVVGDLQISMPTAINKSQKMFGNEHAVTVDDVIVFSREPDLDNASDIEWWAHELHHVFQYTNWGVDLFAYRYAKNYSRVENEAEQAASHVKSYLTQLGQIQITPKISFSSIQATIPVTIDTPVGKTVIHKPTANFASSLRTGPQLTDRCIIGGEYLAINSSNKVLSISQGGIQVGIRVSTIDPYNCIFDLVAPTGYRYCVHKPTGFVYAGTPFQHGQCSRCTGNLCLQ